MRIVQVNKFHYLRGGSERYYFDLSAALAARGHAVQFLSMRHAKNVPASPHDRFVAEVDYRAQHNWWQKARLGLRSIHNREAARMACELAANGPECVAHFHNVAHQLTTSIIGAFASRGVPMVQTLHDYKLICPNALMLTGGKICHRCQGGRYLNAARHRCLLDSRAASVIAAIEAYWTKWRRIYDRIDRFICPSRFMLETVASFGVPRDRLVHLPHFLPLTSYPQVDVPQVSVCVYAGRLSHEKGIATLIEAIARLPRGDLQLRVLGEGPIREEMEQLATRRCPGRVQFLGYLSGAALQAAIQQAAFAVVPSEWYENLPYAVMETFALGRAVVGARIGGIPELVEDGITGRLFTSGDAASLAEALDWMLGPAANLQTLGANARRKIEREFAEEAHVARVLEIYREVSA